MMEMVAKGLMMGQGEQGSYAGFRLLSSLDPQCQRHKENFWLILEPLELGQVQLSPLEPHPSRLLLPQSAVAGEGGGKAPREERAHGNLLQPFLGGPWALIQLISGSNSDSRDTQKHRHPTDTPAKEQPHDTVADAQTRTFAQKHTYTRMCPDT